jgi:alpha-1,2-mannosyltransferase
MIGVASAIKLTPLIFIPHLILTRRHADAARAAGTFVALQGLGWLLLPSDSWRFFTGAMMAGNGNRTFEAANQSLHGLVQRLSGEAPDAFAISLALAVICLAVHAILVRRLHRHEQHLAALLVTAFCGLLISPVTWTHHWVWVVPLCLLLGYRVYRRGLSRHSVAAGGLLLIVLPTFSIDFRLFVPIGNRLELGWTTLEILVGNAYLIAAIMVGLVGAVLVATHRPGLLDQGLSRVPSQRQPEPAQLPVTSPPQW